MEIITSVAGKIVELTVESIGRQFSYLCFITRNIQKLKSNIEMLKETRETVHRMVNDARRNAEDIKVGVQNWLTKVDAIIERSEEILTNEGQQVRFCLNLVQRHQLSRKAVKMANEVLEVKNEGSFDRVSYSVPKCESSFIRTSDFLDFESRRSTKEKIMDALMDDNVQKIGIYGMGGVGKTMIVKEISREVMEKKFFDEVVTSTISQTQDLKRVQGELAEKLGLKLEKDTIEGRALMLHKRLMKEKRTLIVLDDIWAPIDLEIIGIPSDIDHKGCKILFTSRDKHTLSNDMCINKIFEIKVLYEDESLDLFKRISGDQTIDFKHIVIEIVRECANLPIAIITVAKALKNKHISVWIDALDQLRKPEAISIRGMNDKVYASLKLSYEQLECEAKMLFLICSMFPEDFKIDMQLLHIYAMAFNFLHGVDTVAKGRHRIIKLIDDLTSSCLLQNCEDVNDHVKMHDVVRDVAISISSKDDQICTLSYGKNWNEREVDKEAGNPTAVYLDFNNRENSPKKLMFPKVKLLILEGRWGFTREVSINFFEEMKDLQVLVLEWMKISFLPQSLHFFTNVISLHLYHSELENIDIIGQFNKLEILSFKGSNITEIPISISQLTLLKVLDLSSCNELEVIPPNILSNLSKLEELNLETYSGWEREELYTERKNASLCELKSLSRLSTLCLYIENEKVIPRQMLSLELKLEVFDISIGSPQRLFHCHEEINRKALYLKMDSEYCMNDGIKMLLKRCETLHLEGARVFLFGLDKNESSLVKHLDLLNICGLQHIIHSQKQPFEKVLSNLVHLCLNGLENLVCIIHGNGGKSLFNKLKFINVEECKKLAALFINCSHDDLSNLEEIKIGKCKMMEVIVVMANKGATNKFEFTHLKTLHLRCLAQLKNFSSKIEKDKTSNFSSNNDSFFNEEVSLPSLKTLKIEQVGNLKMICGNILFPNPFSKLAKVCIDFCNNLEKVFSWRIMSNLTCLKSVSIKNCNLLEEIFEAQRSNIIEERADLLPQLRELKLYNLPNLRYVWSEDLCELLAFKNMETLSIHLCPKLRKECVINVLSQLKHWETDLNGMKEIFGKERSIHTSELHQFNTPKDGSMLFSKLKTLKINDTLDHHKTHLSMEILHILPCLENFEVENALIEEIFPSESLISVKEDQYTTSEHLKLLALCKLPKLKHLWKEGSQNNTPILLQHLTFLKIEKCGLLNILVPSSVSFRNLKYLFVAECHRLTHLLKPSVAKVLVQLEWLRLRECKMMKTVIDHFGGVEEGNDEIVFNKLQTLGLAQFPNITSFHSGRCTIKFPCLRAVYIHSCPEMKVFSFSTVNTPRLNSESIFISYGYRPTRPRDFKNFVVEDINVIVQREWEGSFDSGNPHLFAEKNLDENQSDHSSLDVEEQ